MGKSNLETDGAPDEPTSLTSVWSRAPPPERLQSLEPQTSIFATMRVTAKLCCCLFVAIIKAVVGKTSNIAAARIRQPETLK